MNISILLLIGALLTLVIIVPVYLRTSKKSTGDTPYAYDDILHLWEDDYLMIELLPNENIEFVKAETIRINDFAQEHFAGAGFSDITPIGQIPVKTIEKLIDISQVEALLSGAGLKKIHQFHMQGVGLIEGAKAPLGFGTNKFAVLCDRQGSLLQNISMTGHAHTVEEKEILIMALLRFGQTFNFIAVNWYRGEYYNLVEKASVAAFVEDSC